MKPRRTESEPHDRLTRIGNRLLDALADDPEHQEGDRCVVFLAGGGMYGTCIGGYEPPHPDLTAMVDVFVHMQAVFKAAGKDLKLFPIIGHD